MKNITKIAFGCVIMAICVLAVLGGCAQTGIWKKPEVSFSSARIVGFNLEEVRLELDLAVTNRNSYSIPYKALEYAVSVEMAPLFSGKMDSEGTFEAGETSPLTLPFTIKFKDIITLVSNFKLGNGVDYTLEGNIILKVPLIGEVTLPLRDEGTLPTK